MENQDINILILDDDSSVRQSLANFLEDEAFNIFTADCTENGLKMIKKERIDIAIVDIRLPDMDGNIFISKAYQTTLRLLLASKWPNFYRQRRSQPT